ncbi:thiamine pyrophosphate-dependent dehydrogenase E1 component subunit alpha [Chloroflexota bacterium]
MTNEDLLRIYRYMLCARFFDEKMSGQTSGWHSSLGEEASIVGTFFDLRREDWIYPHFRGAWIGYNVKGMSYKDVFVELYGRASGTGQGKGFSMPGSLDWHILPMPASALGIGFTMSTGVALALRVRGSDDVVVVNFGDGTSNRGEFHESLNFASLRKLPIVFVCQNNQYAVSTHVSKSIATPDVADRAAAYGIPGLIVDGNDVLEVHEAVQNAVSEARHGGGPSLVECKTYRIQGHFEADPEGYRTKEEIMSWREKDPILRFKSYLNECGLLSAELDKEMNGDALLEINEGLGSAKASPRVSVTREHIEANLYPSGAGGYR